MAQLCVVTLCTGNAARSVLAGALLAAARPDIQVATAGTHVVEHQPMSVRTRQAFRHLGVDPPNHRSHQLTGSDVARADLVLAMAAEHVAYVRRHYPEAAGRTATVGFLARHLPPQPPDLARRLEALELAHRPVSLTDDIADPAGGDLDAYLACAEAVAAAVADLAVRL
jgi:protein-tyrosine phosphatase